MGNVNAREDGSSSPSAVDEEGGGSVQEDMAAPGHARGESSELMGQSPPHSPRATHSPLMFTPQVSFHLPFSFIIIIFNFLVLSLYFAKFMFLWFG